MLAGSKRWRAVGVATIAVGFIAAWPTNAMASGIRGQGVPEAGGSLTVYESSDSASWADGFDPINSTDLNAPMEDAIFGTLFNEGPSGNAVPNLATGSKVFDGAKKVEIYLRHGVRFQDGTPFDAAAVATDLQQMFEPKNANVSDAFFPVKSVTALNRYTVLMDLTKPDAAIVDSFPGEDPNWIPSPTALEKMGPTAFSINPVGAGPFEVVSDKLSSALVLKRNPNYWQKGHPYLNELSFISSASDQTAYEAVLAKTGQVAENTTTAPLVASAKSQGLDVVQATGRTGTTAVQLNMTKAPLNNITAREALYYATDAPALNKALSYGTGTVVESPSVPGNPFYEADVPGYRSYDLAKASALVKRLGGLTVNLAVDAGADESIGEALQAEWTAAGVKVNLTVLPTIVSLLQAYKSNSWQALVQVAGGPNPAVGTGSSYWRYYSTGPFSGTHDTEVDALVNEAAATTKVGQQVALYRQEYELLNKKAYMIMLYYAPLEVLSQKTVHGPGISTSLEYPIWEDVWVG
jgi:peptide/nickel transport system substrate-binding protein